MTVLAISPHLPASRHPKPCKPSRGARPIAMFGIAGTLTAICYGRPNLKPYQRDCQYFNLAALLIRLPRATGSARPNVVTIRSGCDHSAAAALDHGSKAFDRAWVYRATILRLAER